MGEGECGHCGCRRELTKLAVVAGRQARLAGAAVLRWLAPVLIVLSATAAGAQPVAGRPDAGERAGRPDVYLFELSSVAIERNTAAIEATTRLIDRGALRALDEVVPGDRMRRRGLTGFLLRTGKWLGFDLPVAAYADVFGHEAGHYARLREFGRPAQLIIVGSPWTLSLAQVRTSGLENPAELPAIYAAGFESTVVMRERIERRIAERDFASSMDLTLAVTGVGQTIGYMVRDLDPGRLEPFPPDRPGDPRGHLAALLDLAPGAASPAEYEAWARRVRQRAYLNLVDAGLATAGMGLVRDYLWRGERHVPVRWIRLGPVEVIPRLQYHLTPVGPEQQVRSLYRAGASTGHVYVRWSEPVVGERLAGVGVERSGPLRGGWRPTVRLDVWRNPDGGASARTEVSAEFLRLLDDRLLLRLTGGAKGRGYLVGQPLDAGVYGGVGAGVRFW